MSVASLVTSARAVSATGVVTIQKALLLSTDKVPLTIPRLKPIIRLFLNLILALLYEMLIPALETSTAPCIIIVLLYTSKLVWVLQIAPVTESPPPLIIRLSLN